MNSSYTKFENFILRFSYASKMRFVLFFAFVVSIIIFSLFMHIQNPLVQDLEVQIAGNREHQALAKILETLLDFKFRPSSKEIESVLLELIGEARKKNEELFQKLSQEKRLLFRESENNFVLMETILKQNKKTSTKLNRLIGITRYLIFLTNQVSQLLESTDTSVYRLMVILNVSLVDLEDVILGGKVHDLGFQIKKSLKETRKNLQAALEENTLLSISTSSQATLELLEKMEYMVSDWFVQGANQKNRLHIIKSIFALKNDLFEQLNFILTNQENTLLFRKKVGEACIIFGIGLVLLMYATKVVRRPLLDFKIAVEKLASGDFSARSLISSKDEVGQMSQSFNEMASSFEETMKIIWEMTLKLTNSSSKIFSTAKELEENVNKQELVSQKITTQTKEISYTMNDFVHSLKEVNRTANLTSHLASSGRDRIIEMETTMQVMMKEAKNIVETLSTLQEKVKKINLIISAIVKIADQSNLLSLNTAIRAQKTGMKGVGFSVVAEKIKDLANQTASTTLGIEEKVKEIIEAVFDVVEEVNLFSLQIRTQVEDTMEIGEHLKNLIRHTDEQIITFEEVHQGVQEQTTGIATIHDALVKEMEASKLTKEGTDKLNREIEKLYLATCHLSDMVKTFN